MQFYTQPNWKNPKCQSMDLWYCTRMPLGDGLIEKKACVRYQYCGCDEIRALDEDSVTQLRCLLQRATVHHLSPFPYTYILFQFFSQMKCINASKNRVFSARNNKGCGDMLSSSLCRN